MSRWKAAAIHLLISALIVSVVALGLIFAWYGWELFTATKVARLLGLLALCDVVMGPLLTLLVFRSGKPSLKFDLTVIALLQVGFLAYGLYIMAESRPVFMVAVRDRFELVFANQLDDADLAKGSATEYRTMSWSGPRLVGGRMATSAQDNLNLTLSGLSGRDVQLLPERYIPFDDVATKLLEHAQPVDVLAKAAPAPARERLMAAVQNTGLAEDQVRTLPIVSKRGRATMLVAADSGQPLAAVAVDPWPDLAQ